MSWIKDLFRHVLRVGGPRKESELWSIVLKNEKYFNDGLCHLIETVRLIGLISLGEERQLIDSMWADKFKSYRVDRPYWIGPSYRWEPRKEYILKKIKQLRSEGK
jgi:hypothetical protein